MSFISINRNPKNFKEFSLGSSQDIAVSNNKKDEKSSLAQGAYKANARHPSETLKKEIEKRVSADNDDPFLDYLDRLIS